MKSRLSLIILFSCISIVNDHATPLGLPQTGPMPIATQASKSIPAANYTISVTWKNSDKGTNTLQLVTCEGSFELDTISGTTKMDDREIPNTVKLSGSLKSINEKKGTIQIFIGRTVPYVTSTFSGSGGKNSSSYSQMSVGLQSSFVVTYGKPLQIQSDDNGEVVLLVKRETE